ncbi:peptidoglycan-binding protein [Bacillus sp. DX1.1]|uniref:peptidoglycan-binding protein n=1 Tax=unclassified Bacillus (in: firmicutes) TaxID=185979 RepID=UPI00256FE6A3|nr:MULTISPECIES: peptidoglycan-binding protein [unclassified Bacillus (in: firmicutes)]MDM5154411.1 peptidoglycan-binding protein [Bacillus sp. DX1.1]WJE84041.1 peptidoglycan-binding protein [Bacillus sp. DX3.1]
MNDMNEPLYRQPSGKFFAKIYDKDTEKPIKDVKISIYEMTEEGQVLTSRQSNVITVHTNEFGETDTIALPAPAKENALDPLGSKPYLEYAVSIEAAGYAPVILRGTQIFADVTAKQMMELIPVSGTEGRQSVEVIDIPEHTLIGQYPQQEQQEQQSQPQSTRRNGDYDVLIPEFVIVHDGHPNTPAPRYKVKFKDYIKNVLASEVFPSWRKEALLANALCVMSYTLNRVYTGYYEGKGFTITGITRFDHKYTHGRNTFEETDNVVEEVFKQYIAKPGKIEPLFAQYRAGKKTPCPYATRPGMLYQWGTACLAEQGMNYMEILKYYYKEVEIRLAEFIQVIKSFPGFNLKEGDQKEAVRTVQKYLYHIRKKYKDIPEINVNGIFDQNTTNAVKSFQKHFKLPENGVVDELTWNKITDIYVYVTNLPGMFPILQAGSRGESVKILQILLKKSGFYAGEVDGVFGVGTDKSVKEFQKIKGFTVTGVVRKELWRVLEELQFSVRESRISLPNVANNSMFHETHASLNGNQQNPSSFTNASSNYSSHTPFIPNTSVYQKSIYPYYENGYYPFY